MFSALSKTALTSSTVCVVLSLIVVHSGQLPEIDRDGNDECTHSPESERWEPRRHLFLVVTELMLHRFRLMVFIHADCAHLRPHTATTGKTHTGPDGKPVSGTALFQHHARKLCDCDLAALQDVFAS